MIHQTKTPPIKPAWSYVRVYRDADMVAMFGRYRVTFCASDAMAQFVANDMNAINMTTSASVLAVYVAMPYQDACDLVAAETMRGQ